MDKYLKLDVKMLKLKIYNKLIKINFKINSSSLNLFSIVWFLEPSITVSIWLLLLLLLLHTKFATILSLT